MTDNPDFMRTICTHPDDDTPRRLYADWLEENAAGTVECPECKGEPVKVTRLRTAEMDADEYCVGESYCGRCSRTGSVSDGRAERAEFIRVQCALARWSDPKFCPECDKERRYGWRDKGIEVQDCPNNHEWKPSQYDTLRERERELMRANYIKWLAALAFPGLMSPHGSSVYAVGRNHDDSPTVYLSSPGNEQTATVVIRRGFVDELRCDWPTWAGGPCGRCEERSGVGPRQTWVPFGDCPACRGSGRTPGLCRTLAWRPSWTVECERCSGLGTLRAAGVRGGPKCSECVKGRTPVPMPPGAQPVRRLVLTTPPDIGWMIQASVRHSLVHSNNAKALCETEWPGIECVINEEGNW